MNLLIDTHYLLWAAYDSSRIKGRARDLITATEITPWFSVASLWEVAIKRAFDRKDFRVEPSELRAGLLENGFSELAIQGHHIPALRALPLLHSDPFDRMLLAQAISDGMTLLTMDRKLSAYDGPVAYC